MAGTREPNGQLSRKQAEMAQRRSGFADLAEQEAMSVALEARSRVHAINSEFLSRVVVEDGKKRPTLEQVTRDQMAGTAVGRYCLCGVITRAQYDAAMAWLKDRAAYLQAVSPAQGTEPAAVNLNATGGSSNYENVDAARRAMTSYRAAMKAVEEAQYELRRAANLFVAMDTILVRDSPLEIMVGNLRSALNALARHYGLDGRRRAA
jgi:hypothetical protein